jgi:hypothetical protein
MFAQRVSFDVATNADQGRTGLNGDRLEPALVNVAASPRLVRAGPLVRMFSLHPMHELRKICDSIASHAEVPMVGENLISDYSHAMVISLEALRNNFCERFEIATRPE